jgi:hypothetical protein
MKGTVRSRARIARVRRIQHIQAAAAAQAAQGQLAQLETSAERLAALRGSLAFAPGICSGAALSRIGELAMRLDSAREGLTDAIVSARSVVAERAAQRLEARQRRESAEKLDARAAEALGRLIEQRSSASRPRRKAPGIMGDEE